jgi:hypothetical protein
MAASKPSKRRSVPVRLSEIPLEVRLAAARAEARGAKTPSERSALLRAALCPSDDVFYVTDYERAA